MVDAPRHLSPLARLGRERFEAPGGAVLLEDRSLSAKFLLRSKPADAAFLTAAEGALGVALPLDPNRSAAGATATVFWTQPDEWLVVAAPAQAAGLMAALHGAGLLLTDVSDGRAAFHLSGARALDLLRKGTSVNLHPRAFLPGHAAQTKLAQASVLLHRPGEAAARRCWLPRTRRWCEIFSRCRSKNSDIGF